MNVVIVAGGENTRFKEMSIFPKVLLPTLDYPSILSYDCKLFEDHQVYLIINDRYYEMCLEYINKTKINVKVIVSHNHNGSANTILSCMDELPKKDVLFVWSDLILDKQGVDGIVKDVNSDIDSNIIFSYDGKYRFRVEDDKIMNVKEGGNVPGIYYCKNLNKVFLENEYPDNFDLIEIFQNTLQEYSKVEYKGNILEFRDLETYLDYYKNEGIVKTPTRFFNTMKVEGKKLTKKCINQDFYNLIDREILWYTKCKEYNYKNIPTIYNTDLENHEICMEYLDGYMNVYEFIKNANDEEFDKFMKSYIKAIEDLHNLYLKVVDPQDAIQDYTIEFYEKVIKRCNNIRHIIYNYDEDNLKVILEKAFKEIINLSGNISEYCFAHGDLNGSNVMYNKEKDDIKFIDPRGYFGKSQLIGPAAYDYAKVMYCLSGYDNFNNQRYIFTKDWYEKPHKLRDYEFKDNNRLYLIMVGIIWVALAEYISQDVFKANIAYQHGINILKEQLSWKNL